jgi:hypothetical protein
MLVSNINLPCNLNIPVTIRAIEKTLHEIAVQILSVY